MENWCTPFLRTVAYAVLLPKRANGTVAWHLIWRFFLELTRCPARFSWRDHKR